MLFVIAGLGNPGERYAATRHNCGFRVVDRLVEREGWMFAGRRLRAYWAEGHTQEDRVVLLKPDTFMNLSGEAVGAAVRFLKVEPESLLVVHDDLDLVPGRIQLRRGGGFGGHLGLESVGEHLGTADFCRLRVGVGRPPPEVAASEYVLSPFGADEAERMQQAFDRAAEALLCWMKNGLDAAMNRYNGFREEVEE